MLPTLKTSVNIRLPFSFIFFGLVSLVLSQWILISKGDILTRGIFREPSVWMSAHLLILGWGVMVAMGAMYQLVPVAFLTPIWSEKFGFLQLIVTATGIILLTFSFVLKINWIVTAGGLTVTGIVMFLIQMVMTLRKREKPNIMLLFIGASLLFLLLTIILGFAMSVNIVRGIPGINHVMLLKSHILFGFFGWFTLLIFGFSYKMVPMFALSHGFSMRLSRWVFVIYILGLIVIVTSFVLQISYLLNLGTLLLLVGFLLFYCHIRHILNKRLKKQLDIGFKFGLQSIRIGSILHAIIFIASFFPSLLGSVVGILLYAYIFGWITFSIVGYLFKIVPFLWWTHRYGEQMGKANVPTLKQITDEKIGSYVFIVLTVGLIGVLISLLLHVTLLYTVSQLCIAVAITVYAYITLNVLRK